MGSRLEANSNAVRKRIEKHEFHDEQGEEYSASGFGGFNDYFRRKKIKLQNRDVERRQNNPEKSQIFRGVVAHVNGYTQPSLTDLHNMIVDHGGGFIQYLDTKTMATHIIAANITLKKAAEFRKYRIVKPAWVVDSINAGKLLPWSNYKVVDEGTHQNVLGFNNGTITSQAGKQRTGYKDQMHDSWYASQVKDKASQIGGTAKQSIASAHEKVSPEKVLSEKLVASEVDKSVETETETSFGGTADGMHLDEDHDLLDIDPDRNNSKDAAEQNTNESTTETYDASHSAQSTHIANPNKQKELSAAEHNAELLTDPRIWKSTAVNPGFLKQYYEESRLHHLSTWKAELKSRLQALAHERTSSQKQRQKRPPGSRRYILHVDFDCFFAAVSLKQRPEWIDKPAVVAHGDGSGSEIASCNYVARKYGVKNGMWMKTAKELCPDLKVLPYDFKAYEKASRDFYDAAMGTGGVVQSVSIDEALIDVSLACIEAGGHEGKGNNDGSMYREQSRANEIAQSIRDTVKEKTGCAVSIGIGGNILLAKLALRKAKPAGQYQIKSDEVLDFIGDFTVQDLPGVAYSIGGKFEEMGVKLIKDVRALSKEKLINALGPKTGEKMWEYSRGIDRVEVGDQVIRKSVSAEVNWGIRFVTQEQADAFVSSLCEEVHKRLVNERVKGRQITVKIMRRARDVSMDPPKHLGHGKCDTFNKSAALGFATNEHQTITREVLSMMRVIACPPAELRGIGVQVTKLEPLKGLQQEESSQKRLQFLKPAVPKRVKSETIEESTETNIKDPLDVSAGEDEIIDSPRKPSTAPLHPAAALAAQGTKGDSSTLLNTLGTQFILPTQVDPEVFSELPENIRSKFKANTASKNIDRQQGLLNFKAPQLPNPSHTSSADVIPSESQLDPESLAALPDDVREEVLAFYRKPQKGLVSTTPSPSPQKARQLKQPKTPSTPSKNQTLLPSEIHSKKFGNSTLTQANYLTRSEKKEDVNAYRISAEVLADLPADIREEILAQYPLTHPDPPAEGLAGREGDEGAESEEEVLVLRHELKLPPPPPRPVFSAKRLSKLPELRDAVCAWVEALAGEEPHEADAGVLAAYLKRVVTEERDMEKAVAVAKWLGWLVSEMDEKDKLAWAQAVTIVRNGVLEGVKERMLGEVEF